MDDIGAVIDQASRSFDALALALVPYLDLMCRLNCPAELEYSEWQLWPDVTDYPTPKTKLRLN